MSEIEANGPDSFGDFHITSKGENLAKCVVVQNGFRTPEETFDIAKQLIFRWNSHEALVKALTDLEDACERVAANRTRKVYLAMIDAGQSTDDLTELDAARLSARTIIDPVGTGKEP